MAEILVLIIRTTTQTDQKHIKDLQKLFSDPFFETRIVNTGVNNGISDKQNIPQILASIENKWDNKNVVVIYDTSISYLSSEDMKNMISTALNKTKADVYFLCSWDDPCTKYTDASQDRRYPLKGMLQQTFNGKVNQANMYTYYARQIITRKIPMTNGRMFDEDFLSGLSTAVANNNLRAITWVPNIVDFNIEVATSHMDLNKLNKCIAVNTNTISSANTTATYVWFFIMIILVIILAWALIKVGPRS